MTELEEVLNEVQKLTESIPINEHAPPNRPTHPWFGGEACKRLFDWVDEQVNLNQWHPTRHVEGWSAPLGAEPKPDTNALVISLLDVGDEVEAKQLDIVLLLNRMELHHCNAYCQKVDPVTGDNICVALVMVTRGGPIGLVAWHLVAPLGNARMIHSQILVSVNRASPGGDLRILRRILHQHESGE
jgi:hypothetical protein